MFSFSSMSNSLSQSDANTMRPTKLRASVGSSTSGSSASPMRSVCACAPTVATSGACENQHKALQAFGHGCSPGGSSARARRAAVGVRANQHSIQPCVALRAFASRELGGQQRVRG